MRQFVPASVATLGLAALGIAFMTGRGLAASSVVMTYQPARARITATVNGSCWTTSIASPRTDAFRCTSGNRIFDPCFKSGGKTVVCPTDLIRNRATLVRLTAALPRNTNPGNAAAWAFQLASGAMCQMGTGTIIPGYPFYCSGPPVCSMPKPVGGLGQYVTSCGKPTAPIKVRFVRSVKVVRIWK